MFQNTHIQFTLAEAHVGETHVGGLNAGALKKHAESPHAASLSASAFLSCQKCLLAIFMRMKCSQDI